MFSTAELLVKICCILYYHMFNEIKLYIRDTGIGGSSNDAAVNGRQQQRTFHTTDEQTNRRTDKQMDIAIA